MEKNIFVLENLKYICSAKFGSVWFSDIEINSLFQMMEDKMNEIRKSHPYLRKGQILYNLAYHVFRDQFVPQADSPKIPPCLEKTGTDIDCYAVDERIPKFFRALRGDLFRKMYELRDFKKSEFVDD